MKNILNGFISPASIAVVGASRDTAKPSGKIVENLLSQGYAGELFLINPQPAPIQGRPVVAAIKDLPHAPDLAYIAIPARFVATALTELAELGARRVIILSAGFGEVSPAGLAEERRLAEIADRYGVVLLGPNCLGVTSPVHQGKFAGLLPQMRPGGIDFISGSGATVDILAEQAVRRGLSFHTFFTVGNSAQTGVTDLVALFDEQEWEQPPAHIMLYLEKVGDPQKMLRHARSLAEKGAVIMAIKAGVTEGGRRAAASHTGAMLAKDAAVQALFDKAGLIRVQSKLEMVDVATALVLAQGRYDGRRACVITDAGGPGVMATDELNRQGIATPAFKPETKKLLQELLPPGAGVANPVDMLPTRSPEQLTRVLEILAREEADNLDYILLQFGQPGFTDNWPLFQAIIAAMDNLPLPVFPSFAVSLSAGDAMAKFRAAGKCHFEDEVSMARAVGRMVNRPRLFAPAPDPPGYDREQVTAALAGVRGVAPPAAARRVLTAAGIPVPGQAEVHTPGELARLAETLPAPWVMKVLGPLHKSDLGGVLLGVEPAQAPEAFSRLMGIAGASGVLVQETLAGPEVLLGLSREGEFGHLAAVGLGGVLAEALHDIQVALAPLSPEEAARAVHAIKALPVLQGWRGQPGMDLDRVADLLVRVSLLGRDVPQLRELDLNPLKGVGDRLAAVDVRIILD
ncbi:MAG: acetate--CoA ligase family protein [Deltaproteobacteria bacterium]|nr:acetate--CoA ligase family protein [Deltaproteobacteria bacterium]